MKRDFVVHVRVVEKLHRALKQQAEREGRSLSGFVRLLLRSFLAVYEEDAPDVESGESSETAE